MKSLFKRKSKHLSNENVPNISNNDSTISEDISNKYDASFEIKQTTSSSESSDQQPVDHGAKPRRLSFNRNISSLTSPRVKKEPSPISSTSPSYSKKPQPAHSLTLQLEDLLAISYKTRRLSVQKFVFIIDFSFTEAEELYNIVKKAHILFIHAKNQSSWNFSNENSENIVTLSVMGMDRSSIVPIWSSENEKLIELHHRQGFNLDDQNLKRNTLYLLGVKQVLDCCEYFNNNDNFLTNSNPYEENQDIINLDVFAQNLLQNLLISDVNIISSFIEKDKTRFSISHQLLYELEKVIHNSPYSLHLDILKITNRYDLGVLSVPISANEQGNRSEQTERSYNRVIFDTLEQFLKRIRSKKCHDFSFSIGIGKSEIVKTNKELEYNISKCFSLFTINPKLRTNSISFYEESTYTNPLSDFIFHL